MAARSHISDFDMTEFNSARGHAIGIYGNLEQTLCEALAYFGDIDNDVAGVVFFKINNARAVQEILDKLKRRKMGAANSLFWNSLTGNYRKLSETRNLIVHWGTAIAWDESLDARVERRYALLKPPNYWGWDDESPELQIKDIRDFTFQCGANVDALHLFVKSLRGPWSDQEEQTWREIFQQPLTYPIPLDSPLRRRPRAHWLPQGPSDPKPPG